MTNFRTAVFGCGLLLAGATQVAAQIPQDQYLKYVPLTYPRIIRQTEASARLHLYGNREDATYRDESPRDGIDDRRGAWLQALAVRFAPIMVRNTPQAPMDFRAFYARETFPIFIERWDVSRHSFSLVDSVAIDLAKLANRPCPARGTDGNDDCKLMDLIDRFGPGRSPLEPEAVAPAERETVSVMHLDLPGFDEKTWKAEYWPRQGGMHPTIAGALRVFGHPFIAEYPGANGGPPEYELVIQYWFFYPANDGPNNHEGDWEHINVVIAPRSTVTKRFDAQGIERLISGGLPMDGGDPLVMRRIEYYLHHFVYAMDFASPSVYQPRSDWMREVQALADERKVRPKLWERVRERAYRDQAETMVNTRPIVWIGGDAVGVQNVLQTPGLKDQDGHPSYPFRGYYKKIGPGGVGERVIEAFDHFKYFSAGASTSDPVVDYGAPDRVALLPDWERIIDLARTDAGVRRDWAWMLLPLRFGYPASPSPGAGLVAHADMGNVAPIGPTYNNAWNRVGDSAGYEHYDIVEQSWAAPLGALDSFFPRAGFLNAPLLYFMLKPPLDLAWRTLALPARAAVGSRQPTFLPANAPAVRDVSIEVGPMLTDLNDELGNIFFSREQFPEIFLLIALSVPPTAQKMDVKTHFGWAVAPAYSVTFHVSPRFSTESSITIYRARVGFDFVPDVGEPIRTRGDFHQFDYHGTLRFNLRTGAFQPYVKYGHGITWYRLKNVAVNDILISKPTSPRFKPAGKWWDLGFNETVVGGGADWTGRRVGRLWIGMKASYTFMFHDIGFERLAAVEDFPILATVTAGVKYSVWRQQARLLFNISY